MNLLDAAKAAVIRAFGSSKFQVAVLGVITSSLIRFFHVGSDQAGAIANGIVTLIAVFVGAQGLADFGKEAKVVGTAAEPTQKQVAAK